MIAPLLEQKALPHSDESERAVLAGILLEPQVLPTASPRLARTSTSSATSASTGR